MMMGSSIASTSTSTASGRRRGLGRHLRRVRGCTSDPGEGPVTGFDVGGSAGRVSSGRADVVDGLPCHQLFVECVAGASPTFRIADKNAVFYERQNVPESGVLGTLGERSVFRGCELTLEAIEQTI
jgi:hypothetical protein